MSHFFTLKTEIYNYPLLIATLKIADSNSITTPSRTLNSVFVDKY